MTSTIAVDPTHPDPALIARAAECLRNGGIVAFPTETVYGLGAHALDAVAVRRVFAAKGRPANDPLIVHIAHAGDIAPLVRDVPAVARELGARFWPGPLTLVLRRSAAVPDEVTAGLDTVAIRVPSHPVARALLQAAGIPIAAPSANLFSRPSPTRASHVRDDLDDRIDMIVDGGPTPMGVESTVIDLTSDPPAVLRPGAVSVEQLRQVAPTLIVRGARTMESTGAEPMASPGLLSRHYSPQAPLTLFEGNPARVPEALGAAAREAVSQGMRVGVLATRSDLATLRDLPIAVAELGSGDDLEQVAAHLYAALRHLDAERVDLILAADIPSEAGLGRALRDRLRRAAHRIVRA